MPTRGEDDGPWYWNETTSRFQHEIPPDRITSVRTTPRTVTRRIKNLARGFQSFAHRHPKGFAIAVFVVIVFVIPAVFSAIGNHTVTPSVSIPVTLGGPTESTSAVESPALPTSTPVAPTTPPAAGGIGTCFAGTIPDSAGVDLPASVTEVPCSSPQAHYKVIHVIPGTTDKRLCEQFHDPETPFGLSEETVINGRSIPDHVYCMIEISAH